MTVTGSFYRATKGFPVKTLIASGSTLNQLSSALTSSVINADGCTSLAIEVKIGPQGAVHRATGSLQLAKSVTGMNFLPIANTYTSVTGTVVNGVNTNGIVQFDVVPPTSDYVLIWSPALNSSGSIEAFFKTSVR